MKEPKISIIIIHYNTPHFLKTCLDSIFNQTYKNIELIFIDNNSPDKSGIDFVKETYKRSEGCPPQYRERAKRENSTKEKENLKIVANTENLGYAKAANQGIKMAIDADYVVITNPDIIYTETYFEKIIERIEKDKSIAGITGKVYKYDFANNKPTDLIDTVGLFAYKSRRIIDDGQGVLDEGQFNHEREVFGISGACPLYRKSALENVKIFDEYFDEDFFMYKEDVDLSWRLNLYGWKCLYYPQAIAYHGRGTGIVRRFTTKEILKGRSNLSKFQKHYSFRNQHLMEIKNELPGLFFRDFFHIMFRNFAMMVYMTFCEPFLWKSYFQYIKKLPSALKKRKLIMANKKISNKEMGKLFKKKSAYL